MILRTLHFRLVIAAVFFQVSFQQYDPLKDFCRRFAHQTTVIDRKLYIDGGLVNYGNMQQNPTNYTNTWLLYGDLDVNNQNFPQEYETLTKNATVPSVQGGILWADTVNKLFYLYGGEYYLTSPEPFTLWVYDVIYNKWNATSSGGSSQIVRASFGAGVAIDDKAVGYYYGGWLSNASIPGWSGGPLATSNLLRYDMIANSWTNHSGPDTTPRAEGVMLYIPASDSGMLVYFGGVQTPYGAGNGSWSGKQIYLFDIANDKWYMQTATGQVPDMRRRFCAGATWAQDQSSYNIYLYGGLSMPPNTVGFDDVYILSIPSFTWIKWYPTTNMTGYPHHSLSCNVIDNAQMIIMGGTFPNSSQCDVPAVYGMHNLNLGKQDVEGGRWYRFLPNLTSYEVPSEITAVIGGGAKGGATQTAPAHSWADNDLSVYFTRKYKASSPGRTATRYIPPTSTAGNPNTATPSQTQPPASKNAGAIAGGTVGGVVALACCIGIVYFCLRRRDKKGQQAAASPPIEPITPTAELPSSNPASPHSNYSAFHKPAMSPSSRPETANGYPFYPSAPPPLHPSPLSSPPQELETPHHDSKSGGSVMPTFHQPQAPLWHPQQQQHFHPSYSPPPSSPPYPSPQHGAEMAQQYFPPPPQAPPYFPPPGSSVELASARSPVAR
ncbi:hypothetical protein LTR66_013363 [Elasticomyces elasticus]|nr:hypothetical protein LTR66_013363 [Elasticomyces elasticus]